MVTAWPGHKYILYFTDGGSVRLDLKNHRGTFALMWVNIKNGDWAGQNRITGGKQALISPPYNGGCAAVIKKQ